MAALLDDLGLECIALHRSASYRGLDDSLLSYRGNVQPQMPSACTRSAPSPWATATPR